MILRKINNLTSGCVPSGAKHTQKILSTLQSEHSKILNLTFRVVSTTLFFIFVSKNVDNEA